MDFRVRRPLARPSGRPLLALLLLVALALPAADSGAAGETSTRRSLALDLRAGWAFHPDPDDMGLKQQWAEADFDDSSWQRVKTGVPWQEQGFRSYAGVAWLRRVVDVPADWQRVVLGFGGLDGVAELFVNGRPEGRFDGREFGPKTATVEITRDAPPGQRALLAFRVDSRGGFGGFKQPVMLGPTERAVLPPEELAKGLASAHPDWSLPAWADGKPPAWTILGLPGGKSRVLLAADGSFSPAGQYTVSYWLYDQDRRQLVVPQRAGPRSKLTEGLPIAQTEWSDAGVVVKQTLVVSRLRSFAVGPWRLSFLGITIGPWRIPLLDRTIGTGEQNDVAVSHIRVQNQGVQTRHLLVYAAIRAYGVDPDVTPLRSLEYRPDNQAMLVDGQLGVVASVKAEAAGVSDLRSGDVSGFAARGEVPAGTSVNDPEALASGALRYALVLPNSKVFDLTLAMPLQPAPFSAGAARSLQYLDSADAVAEQQQGWHRLLRGADLHLVALHVQDAYYASLAYLLLDQDGGVLTPGPLSYHDLYVRDAAYMAEALLRAGLGDQVRPTLERLLAAQRPDGEFPPVVRADGSTSGQPEYDSQGEGIHALMEYYRFRHDQAWLQRSYPAIQRAAQFLMALRAKNTATDPTLRGILPPSYSAEDLGPPEWHHYWDNYWALIGLRDAADAARALGQADDQATFERERAALEQALSASIRAVMRQQRVTAIPNAPEDPDSPRMARASSPILWPGLLTQFDPDLVRHSFQEYNDRFLRPTGGGYRLNGHDYWPYAGMDVAHGFLLLGMREELWKALDWALTHQTLPDDFAWAEAVDPDRGGLAAGDMPHGWAAAAYVSLLRDMLLYENGDQLEIAAGVPSSWIEAQPISLGQDFAGGELSLTNAPTYFGTANLRLSGTIARDEVNPKKVRTVAISVNISGDVRPPGGYRVHSPYAHPVLAAQVDGKPAKLLPGDVVEAPPGAREIRFQYQ